MDRSEWGNKIRGQRAKDIRLALRLNQSELAELLGVSQATISSWENNGVAGPASFALHALEYHQRNEQERQIEEGRHPARVQLWSPDPQPKQVEESGFLVGFLQAIESASAMARVRKDAERSMSEITDIELEWEPDFEPIEHNKRAKTDDPSLVFVPVGGRAILSVLTDSRTNQLLWKRLSNTRDIIMSASNHGMQLVFVISIEAPPHHPFEPVSRWHLRLEQTFYQTSTRQSG